MFHFFVVVPTCTSSSIPTPTRLPLPAYPCLSLLSTLQNGVASTPPTASWVGSLIPDAQANQLSPQTPMASWHTWG